MSCSILEKKLFSSEQSIIKSPVEVRWQVESAGLGNNFQNMWPEAELGKADYVDYTDWLIGEYTRVAGHWSAETVHRNLQVPGR